MNIDQIKAEHPEAAAQLIAQGATAERERIKAIEGQSIPGHEKLIATLKFDGTSTAGDAAMAVLAAERTARATHAQGNASDAPEPLPLAPEAAGAKPAVDAKDKSRTELDTEAKAFMAAHPGTTYVAAYKAVGGK